jgi:hypothetical protein
VINASEIELIEEEVKEKEEEEEEEEENEEEDKFIMTTKEIEKQNYCFSHHYCSPFFCKNAHLLLAAAAIPIIYRRSKETKKISACLDVIPPQIII